MTDLKRHEASGRSYLAGYAAAVVLTAIPFAAVVLGGLSRPMLDWVIGLAALVQIVVHLRWFLHIDLSHTPRENLLALAFAGVIVILMVGGTLWIMNDLRARMSMAAWSDGALQSGIGLTSANPVVQPLRGS